MPTKVEQLKRIILIMDKDADVSKCNTVEKCLGVLADVLEAKNGTEESKNEVQ